MLPSSPGVRGREEKVKGERDGEARENMRREKGKGEAMLVTEKVTDTEMEMRYRKWRMIRGKGMIDGRENERKSEEREINAS